MIGREQSVQHTPVRRNDWEVVVRRLALPDAAKLLALLLATFANPDGSSIRPGDELVGDLCDWSQKYVREQMKVLRDFGLIECVRPAARRRAAVYQLTFPGEGTEPAPLRVDPAGVRLVERTRGRGGRKPKLTGTPVPVNQDDDGNSSSGHDEDDRNWSSPQEPDDRNWNSGQSGPDGPMTGTGVPVTESSPELEFPMTGTGVPNDRNSSSPHHYRPLQDQSWVETDLPPTSEVDQEASEETSPSQHNLADPERLREAYRKARGVIAAAPETQRAAAMDHGIRLAAERGLTGARWPTILAAEYLDELSVAADTIR
ncbi:MAG TPA: hypothetical protein VGS97_20150 [Actinocrinis sp.]|nr:hypothetical protein [Actinocrinis sp.]